MGFKSTLTGIPPAVLLLAGFFALGAGPLGKASPAVPHRKIYLFPGPPAQRRADYGNLPLAFEPNQGQTAPQVQYVARGRGYSLFLTAEGSVLELQKSRIPPPPSRAHASAPKRFTQWGKSHPSPPTPTLLRLELQGASGAAAFEGQARLPGVSNYFIGRNPALWRRNIPQYGKVLAPGVYPGVDLAYYGNQGKLEYDFVVKAGADPGAIRLQYEGASSARINAEGDLELGTGQGTVRFLAPQVYQENQGLKTIVGGRYRLDQGAQVGFEVGAYDRARPLVIDPVLDYSTYWGGSGQDWGTGIALDAADNAYVAGYTTSADFPVTQALQAALSGAQNAFVDEIDSSGTVMLYSTYLGGSDTDMANGIQVDAAGEAYIVGATDSPDFPVTNAVQTALSNAYDNAFAAEFSAGGGSLVFSTYLGGSGNAGEGGGDYGQAIALDAAGGIYLGGYTLSYDFPVTNAYQGTLNGTVNGFLAKLNPSGAGLAYSTFLGGSAEDGCFGVAVDANQDAYLTGVATSSNFPVTNASNLDPTFGGDENAFVAEMNTGDSALVYSSYLGGSATDFGSGIAVDPQGDAYVAGSTTSANFPVTNAYQASLSNSYGNAFLTEVASGGASFVYSTYLGGSGNANGYGDYGIAVAVDSEDYAYVAGYTGSTNFPNVNAVQTQNNSPYGTCFLTQVAAGGGGLVYSTFLGGSLFDEAEGVAVDNTGDAFLTGTTYSTDFPVTVVPPQSELAGENNSFIAEISAPLPASPTDTPASTTPTATPTSTGTLEPTPTPTPTFTLTPTASPASTATPTATPPVVTVAIGQPYPDPISGSGPIQIPLTAPTGSTAHWSVYTVGFRKIYDRVQALPGDTAALSWNLSDNWGNPAANGLYYIRVEVTGLTHASAVLKLLVLR